MTHPVVASLLAALPGVTVERAAIRDRGEYWHADRRIRIRHGLRGPEWACALVHEAVHALRGDAPCTDPRDEARQEEVVRRDAARLLVDIKALGEAAAMYRDDAHRVAEELDVDYETLRTRMRHLHPAERHYLLRRLAPEEETA